MPGVQDWSKAGSPQILAQLQSQQKGKLKMVIKGGEPKKKTTKKAAPKKATKKKAAKKK